MKSIFLNMVCKQTILYEKWKGLKLPGSYSLIESFYDEREDQGWVG